MTNILSPKSAGGSFVYSLAAHFLVAAAVVAALKIDFKPPEAAPDFVDLGYETFEAPPMQAPPKPPVEEKMEELQDKTSEIVGTQKENKTETGDGAAAKNEPPPNVPYYKHKHKDPKAALLAGTEGWILLEVDITETGEVENIRVIDGEQRSTFQSEAKRAVSLWKYRPFLDAAGKPVKKLNHQIRVEFNLVDAGTDEESRASL